MSELSLPRVDGDTDADKIGELVEEHGAVIVERLFPAEVIDAVNAELDSAVDAADPEMHLHNEVLDEFHGQTTRHVTGLPGKSPTFATEVMAHPLYRSLCERFLSPSEKAFLTNPTTWQLNLAHFIVRGPGSEAQLLHRDEDIFMDVPYPRPDELMLASVIAFVDFSRDCGATRVVPGSHRWDDRELGLFQRGVDPGSFEPQAVYAEMPAGSAVIYVGGTYHGASANTTSDVWRRGAHMSFARGWLRTEENNYLAYPPDVVRTLPRECQELLGYPVYRFQGNVDLLDPIELLADGRL